MRARLSEGFLRAWQDYSHGGAHRQGGGHRPGALTQGEIRRRTGVHIATIQKGWINVSRDNEQRLKRVLRGLGKLADIIEYDGAVFESGCRLTVDRS